jgi:hypothetical protein
MKKLFHKGWQNVAQQGRMVQKQVSPDLLDPAHEWRCISAETWGTFLLALRRRWRGPGCQERQGCRLGHAGGSTRAHGDGDHLLNGHGQRRASEPGSYFGICAAA